MRRQVVPRVPLDAPNPWGGCGANGAVGPVRTHFLRLIPPFWARFGATQAVSPRDAPRRPRTGFPYGFLRWPIREEVGGGG